MVNYEMIDANMTKSSKLNLKTVIEI
jgi:hypothetical protein